MILLTVGCHRSVVVPDCAMATHRRHILYSSAIDIITIEKKNEETFDSPHQSPDLIFNTMY